MKSTAQARKKRRRRRDAAVSALLILAVICVCIVIVYCTDIFSVRQIVINSDGERYQNTDILNSSGITQGDRLFLVRLSEAEKKLTTSLPYIRTADVSRSIDGTVTIDLVYGNAYYFISGLSGIVLINEDGKVLENNAAFAPDDISEIFDVDLVAATPGYPVEVAQADVFKKVRTLASLFEKSGIQNVSAYSFPSDNDIRIEIGYKVVVKINSVDEIADRMNFLSEALAGALNSSPSGDRVIFEMTADGAWSARGENSIEQSERLARERLTSTQPVTDDEGNVVTTAASQQADDNAEGEPAGEAVTTAHEVASEESSERDTSAAEEEESSGEQVFG